MTDKHVIWILGTKMLGHELMDDSGQFRIVARGQSGSTWPVFNPINDLRQLQGCYLAAKERINSFDLHFGCEMSRLVCSGHHTYLDFSAVLSRPETAARAIVNVMIDKGVA
jgi:hypothetical protein